MTYSDDLRMKAISLTPSTMPPMIDLDLQPSITAGLFFSDIAHGAHLVSKLGMHYEREAGHHLVSLPHNFKTFDKGRAATALSDEFIELECTERKGVWDG